MPQGNLGISKHDETCGGPIILTPRASPFTKRSILTDEKKWKVIHVHSRDGGDLAVLVSKMIATLRHFDQEKRAVLRNGSNSAKIKMAFDVLSELFRDTLVVFQSPTWWNKHLFHTIGKSTFTTEEVRAFFSLFWDVEYIREEKRRTRFVKQSF